MGLLSTEVEVTLCSTTIKYYEDLGYEIPRIKNKWRRYTVPKGTKILVRVQDLQKASSVKVEIECDRCQKKYQDTYANYQRVNHEGKVYCRACAKKIFNSGSNHPLYNPNITDEERARKRNYNDYIDFIKRVLQRDNYICQCCKNRILGNAQVHHLDGYNWCIEKRTDDTNGITLCRSCHSNFHAQYGKGNNTKEQFEEWMHKIICLTKYNGTISSARQVYCYEENKIYDGVKDFCQKHNVKSKHNVYGVCNNVQSCLTVCGLHLFWYDEYINMSEEDIQQHIKDRTSKRLRSVICLTTNKIFNSITEAMLCYNCSDHISDCCKGKRQYCGTLPDGTRLQWMYYDEYILNQKKQINETY